MAPPSAPIMVTAVPSSEDSIVVSIVPPLDNGGVEITEYVIELDAAESRGYLAGASSRMLYSRHEVQIITISSPEDSLEGSFRIRFLDHQASDISVHSTAEQMRHALESLPVTGTVAVRLLELGDEDRFGHQWVVRFLSFDDDVPSMEVSTSEGSSWGAVASGIAFGVSAPTSSIAPGGAFVRVDEAAKGLEGFEQQDVSITEAVGGAFKLIFKG